MNMCVADISELKNPKVGEKVVIYSAQNDDKNSLVNAAEIAGTIPYELSVHIAESVKRSII
jgi:alanine racemase